MADRWVAPVLVRRQYGNKIEWKSLNSKSDANGVSIHASIFTDYSQPRFNDAPVVEIYREDRNGNRVGDTLFLQPEAIDGFIPRLDDLNLKIAGGNAHSRMSSHGQTIGGLRDAFQHGDVGVGWYAPFPGSPEGEQGGAETFLTTGGSGGGGGVTHE